MTLSFIGRVPNGPHQLHVQIRFCTLRAYLMATRCAVYALSIIVISPPSPVCPERLVQGCLRVSAERRMGSG